MAQSSFKQAFVASLPVLTGYLALGSAFGVMFARAGFTAPLAAVMSLTIYGGSMQFAAVGMLSDMMALGQIALLSIFINIRHIVYGLSLIEPFRAAGWRKYYLVFALTDETYALLTNVKIPPGADPGKFMFQIAMLNHSYWIAGGVIGTLAGTYLNFNSRGIEFTMTALFIVILTEQCMEKRNRMPAALGFAATIGARLLFGPEQMLLPAMICIIAVLMWRKPRKLQEKEP